MNRPAQPIDPALVPQMLWYGMAGSVVLLGLVLFILDQQMPRQPVAAELEMLLKGIGLAALIPFPLFRHLTGARIIGGADARTLRPDEAEQRRRLMQLIIGASLAELPLMVMLVYVAVGGALVWGLAAWIASFGFLLSIRPEGGRVI